MKRIFRFLFFLLILLIGSAVIIPIVFKDSIVERIKQEANANLNARLDFEDVHVSLISSFPYFGFGLEGLSITGVDQFEGQKLVTADDFSLSIDLMSVISGEAYRIEKIALEGVDLHILVLEDGSANYDIAKADTSAVVAEETTETSAFQIALSSYKVEGLDFRYEDRQGAIDFIMKGLDHSGSGDFTQNVVDLSTTTEIQALSFILEDVAYMSRVHVASDFDVKLNQEKFRFDFGDNYVALNGLQLNFEGMLAMPDEAISMDLKFSSPSNSFKSIISLIPALYYQDFEALETSGEFKLKGLVQGVYVNNIYPSFNIDLMVREGQFHYPDLPSSVEDVNIDLKVKNNSRNLDNMLVNLSRFDAKAAGSVIHSTMVLKDPMNDMDYSILAQAKADLADVLKVLPLEGYELSGLIDMDFNTSGRMSMIENEQYEDLKANGYIKADQVHLGGDSLGMALDIVTSELQLSPQEADLKPTVLVYEGQRMELKGALDNIIGYALSDDLLSGSLDFYSPNLDLMALAGEEASAETTDTAAADTTAMHVIRLPENLDFALNARIDSLIYNALDITNLKGQIGLKAGMANMDVDMKMLEGALNMKGSYNSIPAAPIADFEFAIKNFSFKQSYESLEMVRQIAPLMQNVDGSYNLGLDLSTHLGDDMSPQMKTINATGLLNTRSVQMGGKTLGQIATFLQNPDYQNLAVSDVDMEFSIENGTIIIEPFDFKMAGQQAELGGTMNLDQELDLDLKIDIPLKSFKADKYLAQFQSLSSGSIPLTVNIGGTASSPEIKPSVGDLKQQLGQEIKQTITNVVDSAKTKVKDEANKKLQQLVAAAEAQGDRLINEAKAKGEVLKREAKIQADKLRTEGDKAAQRILDEAGSNPLKQAAARPLADQTRKAAQEKAQKLEDEANKKANDLIKAAENQKQKLIEDAKAKAQV